MKVIENVNKAIEELVNVFCEKQDLDFDFWVVDNPTTTASFNSMYFFSLDDIYFDIKTKQPKHRIIEYQDKCVDNNNFNVNYYSYCLGKEIDFIKEIPF